MTDKSKKSIRKQPWRSKYDDDTAQKFYDLRAQGKSLAQAARALGTTVTALQVWANDDTKPEFQEAYKAGREASQAWHEDLLDKFLIGDEKVTGAQKDLLVFKLRTQFRDDWSEKRESTININDQTKTMSDTELDEKVEFMLRKLMKLPPDLKNVKKDGSKES